MAAVIQEMSPKIPDEADGSIDRIPRLRHRYQQGPATISVERARYFTESWRETKGRDIPQSLRVALAMRNVFEKMTIYLDPDDRIAGHWTEGFLGLPLPLERGEYNRVLAAELTKKDMVLARARSMLRGVSYMVRKGALGDFVRNQRIGRSSGRSPLNMDFKTMSEREINPFQIADTDRRELLDELLPYWEGGGGSLADRLEEELIASDLYSRDMHDFAVALTGNTSRQVFMLSTIATIATIQGHVILDYSGVLQQGLKAMRDEVEARRSAGGGLDEDRDAFLESLSLALEGVMTFARRLADRIEGELETTTDPERRSMLSSLLETCRWVPEKPARTFTEAVQALWTVKTAVEMAHPINLHCFGRLDQILFPYYQADLDAGRIDRDDALELLEELLLKIMSQNIRPESNLLSNFYHRFLGSSPVTLSGTRPDGGDGTNEVTYLFLEAAHRSRAVTNIAVRINPDTPDELLQTVAQYLREGTSSFSLFNDETHIEAMERRGFSEEDARDYALMGCVEATSPGRTGSMSANALLLTRLLDVTLRNGDSAVLAGTLHGEGLSTGDPDRFESFDQLLDALFEQGRHSIEKIVAGSDLRDRLHADHLPAPYISAFMDGCLEKERDVTRGGARYDLAGISMINSIANLVDSLHVIRTLVFEQRRCTISELLGALDNDFVGHEELLATIRGIRGKWGNGSPETDALAHRVMQGLFKETYCHRSFKGAPFVVYVISMITHTIDGRLSIASADSRRAGTPYAASCNPYNVERNGPTAVLRSVAALPFEDVLGSAVNMKFHPTAIGDTPEARSKWVSLIRTYFELGGAQLQPTCVSAEMLREAQRQPEEHRDLIIKVGGYSTYFVDLGREIQDEVIARTEHR